MIHKKTEFLRVTVRIKEGYRDEDKKEGIRMNENLSRRQVCLPLLLMQVGTVWEGDRP